MERFTAFLVQSCALRAIFDFDASEVTVSHCRLFVKGLGRCLFNVGVGAANIQDSVVVNVRNPATFMCKLIVVVDSMLSLVGDGDTGDSTFVMFFVNSDIKLGLSEKNR